MTIADQALCDLHGLDYRIACEECQDKHRFIKDTITQQIEATIASYGGTYDCNSDMS